MTTEQRGYLMIGAATALGVCLVIIVAGFVIIAVRAGDGEATQILTDNLWQLVWPLLGTMAALAGFSHFSPATGGKSVSDAPPAAIAPSDPTTSDAGGA